MSATPLPVISVVICSYNGAATLGACLEALDHQTIRDQIEIIVVDDGSTDDTVEVARSHTAQLISHTENQGTSAARNTGILAARAPIIAFTDDDCVPHEDWLQELIKPYSRDNVAGVGGSVSVAHIETFMHRYLADNHPHAPLELDLAKSSSLTYRLWLYLLRNWSSGKERQSRAVFSFPGSNMSFKREVLDAVGLMDARFTFGGDDERICEMVRDRFPDLVLWFEPSAIVGHDYVGTLRDSLRRSYVYGRGDVRYYFLESERSWPTIFPLPIAVLLCAALRRPRQLALLLVLVQLILPQGMLGILRHRRPTNIAFSYVRLLEEAAHDAGVIMELIGGFSRGESRRPE